MRFFCVLLGYLFGCFLTAEIVAHHKTGKRVFNIGSRNPGMANIALSLGKKSAAVTLLGDILKTALPCLLCRFVLFPSLGRVAVLYAGVGAALGHGFPFWHKFRGGRGVAVTCSYLILFSPLWGCIAELMGLGAVLLTGYLTIGALCIPFLFLPPAFLFYGSEAGLVSTAGAALMFILNFDSLKKMRNKEEKKVDLVGRFKKC
ncbi:Glycerol-3-phosphate acyltransferase [bioreactor metagenome]|uniref:Glycerol-3-phosphate acyltransferase n=1 Tax=bioreactor metagenome TaxID=1076179 RepID=A0A644Z2I9_9ZZZZ